MKAQIVTEADLPDPPAELPCGCRIPFYWCAVADALVLAEVEAGEEMKRLGQEGAPESVYRAARDRWRAAVAAYDAHIGKR